jgi:drug/metabolite transporter (DMT)-like permease
MGMQSFLTWGATYTIMSHANLYSSLCSIMIVGLRMATLEPVTKFEIIGCIVALFGCVITTFDPEAIKTSDEDNHIQLGNFLCFISSIFATLYILKGQEVSA